MKIFPNVLRRHFIEELKNVYTYSGELKPGSKHSSFAYVKQITFLFDHVLNELDKRKLPKRYILTIIAKYTIISKLICKLGCEHVHLC